MCSGLELQGRVWETDRRGRSLASHGRKPGFRSCCLGSPGRLEGKANVIPSSSDSFAAAVWDCSAETWAEEHSVIIQRWW